MPIYAAWYFCHRRKGWKTDEGEIVYIKLPSLKKYGMKYRYYIGRDNRKEHDKKAPISRKPFFIGATYRIRTNDPLITNEMLYQLS